MLDRSQAVAALVLDHPECAQVLARHHIDFCCKGGRSLLAAAQERGLDVAVLDAELERAIAGRRGVAVDPRTMTTPQLVEYLVATHHAHLRGALPFVRGLALKVSRVHGERNELLRELPTVLEELSSTLLAHIDEEERALFPALSSARAGVPGIPRQLAAMMDEHLAVAELLARVRAASEDFTAPEWACSSYRTLLAELRQLEADVFTHVHLENHVLRPRFEEV